MKWIRAFRNIESGADRTSRGMNVFDELLEHGPRAAHFVKYLETRCLPQKSQSITMAIFGSKATSKSWTLRARRLDWPDGPRLACAGAAIRKTSHFAMVLTMPPASVTPSSRAIYQPHNP